MEHRGVVDRILKTYKNHTASEIMHGSREDDGEWQCVSEREVEKVTYG